MLATLADFKEYAPQVNVYAQQVLELTGGPTGGTFTIDHNGAPTAALNHNAAPAALQTALRALSGLGAVLVSGERGGPWVVIDQADGLGTRLAIGTNSLTGGTTPSMSATLTIEDVLERASKIVEENTHAWNTATGVDSDVVVYGDGSPFLYPPAYVAGSIEAIEHSSGSAVTYYVERDGVIHLTDSVGNLLYRNYYGLSPAWPRGVAYTITADWGYGPPPDDIVEATLEIAVRIWQARSAGFSDVVGVEGVNAVGYNGRWPAMVKAIFEKHGPALRIA